MFIQMNQTFSVLQITPGNNLRVFFYDYYYNKVLPKTIKDNDFMESAIFKQNWTAQKISQSLIAYY